MTRYKQPFDYVKLKLASERRLLTWGSRLLPNQQFVGEVLNSDTINYKTYEPEMGGLFCERSFGPTKDNECKCGKYKHFERINLICERCGVEIADSTIRRHRMGYINLLYPVTHIWYMNSRPNFLALLLEVENVEKTVITTHTLLSDRCKKYKRNKSFRKKELLRVGWHRLKQFSRLPKPIQRNLSQYDFRLFTNKIIEQQKKKLPCKRLKPILAKVISLWDERVERIKLASLCYFTAEDEISFFGLHWDLQQYRLARQYGISDYPLKPYPKPDKYTYEMPEYLEDATPPYLVGAALILHELKKLNLAKELKRSRKFVTKLHGIRVQKNPEYSLSHWLKGWEGKRISKIKSQEIKRLRLLENLINTGSHPSWTVMHILPVIPPTLRPMIQLEGGQFATSDLNDLYRRIINRNRRLISILNYRLPLLVARNEKRMMQEAVDNLIENGKRGKLATNIHNRPLKSLSDIIKGKYGRLRLNLLGKRVDYSGRSVIVVGPTLKLNQCGLPYEMAIILFQPFIIRELMQLRLVRNIKTGKKFIQNYRSIIEPILKKILKNHPILLNRAPTLHRMGVQAFQPILVNGRAIKLHPLVCTAFNADFDGDQMAVHIPLSMEAQAECYLLMLSSRNFLSPANGQSLIVPSQDMVLGCYYLTLTNLPNLLGSMHYFSNFEDVILAYNQDQLDLHSSIWVRYKFPINDSLKLLESKSLPDGSFIEFYKNFQIRKTKNEKSTVQYIKTTPGRVIFNYTIQKALPFLL